MGLYIPEKSLGRHGERQVILQHALCVEHHGDVGWRGLAASLAEGATPMVGSIRWLWSVAAESKHCSRCHLHHWAPRRDGKAPGGQEPGYVMACTGCPMVLRNGQGVLA